MLAQRQHHPVQGPIADASPPKHRWWQDALIDIAHLHPSSDDRYQSQAENRIMLPWNILTTTWSILHTQKNNKNKTWVLLGHWRITGGKKKNIGHVSNFDWNILMRWWWRWWWQKMRYVVNKYSTLDNLVYIHIHILNLATTRAYTYHLGLSLILMK